MIFGTTFSDLVSKLAMFAPQAAHTSDSPSVSGAPSEAEGRQVVITRPPKPGRYGGGPQLGGARWIVDAEMLRAALLVVGVLIALAGCAPESSSGLQPAETSSTDSGGSLPSRKPLAPRFADLLPPRTRELDLTGVDPCSDLFTDQQLRELDYDLGYARPPLPGRSNIHGGPYCTYGSNGGAGGPHRNIGSLIGISATEGALAWVTDPAREPNTRPEVVDIEGFHALVLPHPLLPDNCLVVVDTAENQYLEVSSSPGGGEYGDVEPYCTEAKRVASMAIQTISSSR